MDILAEEGLERYDVIEVLKDWVTQENCSEKGDFL